MRNTAIPSLALILGACSANGSDDGAAGRGLGRGSTTTPRPSAVGAEPVQPVFVAAPKESELLIADEPMTERPGAGLELLAELPEGFVAAEVGGYQLAGALTDEAIALAQAGDKPCENVVLGVVRDFPRAHPDFEDICCWNVDGMIDSVLGPDKKPFFTADQLGIVDNPQWTTRANFDQWYRSTEGVNEPFILKLWLEPRANGLFMFSSNSFFPVDGVGLGDDGLGRNFHFTTELHMQFYYGGGEVFTFMGDDDLWVYIDNRLVIDIGGVHVAMTETVELDTLGLEVGQTYDLDLFHAERHTGESNFQIETTLQLVNCGTVVPDVRIK